MWWTCDFVKDYWKIIHEWVQKMLKITIVFKPEVFLLNMLPEDLVKKEKYFIVNVATAARILWMKYWKAEKTPAKKK